MQEKENIRTPSGKSIRPAGWGSFHVVELAISEKFPMIDLHSNQYGINYAVLPV